MQIASFIKKYIIGKLQERHLWRTAIWSLASAIPEGAQISDQSISLLIERHQTFYESGQAVQVGH
jgi:hypothetical protein